MIQKMIVSGVCVATITLLLVATAQAEMSIGVDLYPNRVPNRVITDRNYTLYVAALGSATFDVTMLNSSTVKFGKTGTEASPVRAPIIRDLNGDGFLDAMYGFQTFDSGFALGDTQGLLRGKLTDGTDFEGHDTAQVAILGSGSGSLSGWTATGTVQVVNMEYSRDFLGLTQAPASDFWEPTEGNDFISLWSTDGFGTDIATLSQTFLADPQPGLAVEFDYFYDFGDIVPFEDPARIYVADAVGNYIFEMTINDPFAGTGLADDQNIDWTTMNVALPGAGWYTLGFEIQDSIGVFESILGVDNVQVVPVPGAVLLGMLGLSVAGLRLRKHA